MPPLKTSRKYADELAEVVVSTWNTSSADVTPEFGALLHKAFLYITARHRAGNHRGFGILSGGDKDKERIARLVFVRAYKIYRQRQAARFN
jgi:hypothetical protein